MAFFGTFLPFFAIFGLATFLPLLPFIFAILGGKNGLFWHFFAIFRDFRTCHFFATFALFATFFEKLFRNLQKFLRRFIKVAKSGNKITVILRVIFRLFFHHFCKKKEYM
nr:MAG TPA: hypothetical protein [Caudoviricetes sp.]